MPRMTGGQTVVESLRREGIEVVFGLPGVQIMDLYDAFHGRSDIRLVSVRHEQATTYMADGYVRASGRPSAAAIVVPGPGVQNASAGLGTAYSASSPVLLVAGQVPSTELGRDLGAIHEINDQLNVVRPITKWSHRVADSRQIPESIHEAMRQMKTGRPRPTVVEVPSDVLASTVDVELMEPEEYPAAGPDGEEVQRAADLLLSAERPIIWAGGGVHIADATAELLTLAEAVRAPVLHTPEGKGAIPEDHRLFGGVGERGHGPASWFADGADVVLAVGTRMTHQMHGPTTMRPPQRLIHVDVDPDVIGRNYPAEVAIVADARLALRELVQALQGREAPQRWPDDELEARRAAAEGWLRQNAPMQREIIDQIQQVVDDDAIVINGITNIGHWSNFCYKARRPRSYFTASYFYTVGFAFPFALGAKLAAPERQVVCISGDGGFAYTLSELATAVKYG